MPFSSSYIPSSIASSQYLVSSFPTIPQHIIYDHHSLGPFSNGCSRVNLPPGYIRPNQDFLDTDIGRPPLLGISLLSHSTEMVAMQTKSLLTSPGKRCRLSPSDDQMRSPDSMEPVPKTMRTEHAVDEQHSLHDRNIAFPLQYLNTVESDTDRDHPAPDTCKLELGILTSKQKSFLWQWHRDFGQAGCDLSLSNERIRGLATAIETSPQLTAQYIKVQHKNHIDTGQPSDVKRPRNVRLEHHFLTRRPSDIHSLADANPHLSTTTLSLVERYVAACRRRRSQTDGRRSVNKGPFRCTFGCGYETKRAFDWRRHEETHEPQELWLCNICRQRDTLNPFLVNRKDKFLRHVSDKHGEVGVEEVLDKSKVDFRPRAVQGCPLCELEKSWSWDERCKHVLGHFEDEVERGARRPSPVTGQENETLAGEDGNVRSKSISSEATDMSNEKDGETGGNWDSVQD
jgi:hypothetical protein